MKNRLALLVFVLLAGCGETEYRGQAFVKTASDSKKFSDLEIRVISSATLTSSKAAYKRNIDELFVVLQTNQALLAKINALKRQLDEIAITFAMHEGILKPIDSTILPAAKASLEEIEVVTKAKAQANQSRLEHLKEATLPSIYVDESAQTIVKVRTDADGKFSFKAKESGGFIIAAHQDGYYWLVALPMGSDEIILSDSNLAQTKCPACMLNLDQTSALRTELSSYAIQKAKSAATASTSAAAATDDPFIRDLDVLSKKFKTIPSRIGQIQKSKAGLDLLASIGGSVAESRAELAGNAIQLNIDVVNCRSRNEDLLKEFSKRVTTLKADAAKA